MSPRKTFHSCGSSSSEYLRRTRPTRVTRGSFFILKSTPLPSFCSPRGRRGAPRRRRTIERNLYIRKVSPLRPTRSWLKNDRAAVVELDENGDDAKSGASRTSSATPEATKSNARLSTCLPPSNCGISTWMSGQPLDRAEVDARAGDVGEPRGEDEVRSRCPRAARRGCGRSRRRPGAGRRRSPCRRRAGRRPRRRRRGRRPPGPRGRWRRSPLERPPASSAPLRLPVSREAPTTL